jgi:hypothetical protein
MNNSRFSSVATGAALAALFLLSVVAIPARAAEPVFPPGSRIGLVPPTGMVTSDAFAGFADPERNAAILIATLPAAAYSQLEKSLDVDELRKQGISLEKREPMRLSVGKGFLLTGRQASGKEHYRKWLLVAAAADMTALVSVQVPEVSTAYPSNMVRAALATLAVRQTVPEEEQLGLLPFTVGDLAGFHVDGVLPGRALVLTEGSDETAKASAKEAPARSGEARLLIAAAPGGPAEADARGNFARTAFSEIGGIRDVHITMSEPLRIGGQSGYQTMAEAKDARSGADVMVVQWLRFGSGGFLQMTGIARADAWTSTLSRLRAVRDSIQPK